jgi:hypothetical protein
MFNRGYYSRKKKGNSIGSQFSEVEPNLKPNLKVKLTPISPDNSSTNRKTSLPNAPPFQMNGFWSPLPSFLKDKQQEIEIELCRHLGINLNSRESEFEENQSPLIKFEIKTPKRFICKSSAVDKERARSQLRIENQDFTLKRARKLTHLETMNDKPKIFIAKPKNIFLKGNFTADRT